MIRAEDNSTGVLCAKVLLVVLMWSGRALATDGIEPIDVSTQARSRGGADVAVGDSPLSQIDNPATLSLHDVWRVDFSGQLCCPLNHWSGLVDSADSEIRVIPLANIGLSIPVDERTTAGLALHSKAGLASRFYARHLLIPFMKRRIGSDMKDISFSANVGHKLTDRLLIGGGIRAEVATAKFSAVTGPVDIEFGRGYAYGIGFQLGLQYRARDDLTFGLAYRSPTWFSDLAGGEAEASLFGILPIRLGEANLDEFRMPAKVTTGVAWDVTEWLKLVGEVRWLNYSNSSFHSATVATDGLIDLRVPFPLGYRDQWIFIAGAEFKLDDHWRLGVGYNHCTGGVGRSNLIPIGSCVIKHHITVGLRYEQDHWWVGGGYILGLTNSLSGDGHSNIPLGLDYGRSRIEQTQHNFFFGFGVSW